MKYTAEDLLKYTNDLVEEKPNESAYWHLQKLKSKIEEALYIQGVGISLPTDKEIREWSQKEANKWEDKKDIALKDATNLLDGALWMRSKIEEKLKLIPTTITHKNSSVN